MFILHLRYSHTLTGAYTRVILKHPHQALQLALCHAMLLGTPHRSEVPQQLLLGTPHTNCGGMKTSDEGWYPAHLCTKSWSFEI